MGDRLRASKPSRYVTSHLGQLSLLSLRGRQIEYRPVWLGWRQGVLTCVGYQVTLRDPTWQVTLRIAASWGYPLTAYSIPSYLYSPRSFLFLLVVLLLLRRPPSLRLCRFKSDCRLLGLSSPTFPRVGQCHDDPDLQKYWYISNLGTRQNVAGRKRQIFRTMSDNCATWSQPYAERSYCGIYVSQIEERHPFYCCDVFVRRNPILPIFGRIVLQGICSMRAIWSICIHRFKDICAVLKMCRQRQKE